MKKAGGQVDVPLKWHPEPGTLFSRSRPVRKVHREINSGLLRKMTIQWGKVLNGVSGEDPESTRGTAHPTILPHSRQRTFVPSVPARRHWGCVSSLHTNRRSDFLAIDSAIAAVRDRDAPRKLTRKYR